ncbi:prepilin-type N-terminal cleavage/methylation domain-containing protein [Desulfomicrobium macestii]|uniref:Prepilin-type N-terminal cleavage/methylation domain-containing protein n=2 Tax=Desulfomicrobium TaxID=898 RepID=A0A8G2C4J5_DESNO|nr:MULTISPECIES: prepilin-type N-terminal cleavage/methylation domain-containing protein [Desulfomicrobium]MBE1424590.1 prepilin-type N-terminal cleavage/methylation domain-containing protein [Desulfomicrobium macestii]SFL97990.1 prepilin-type N-terminal cleavage/methylation domain-containing protein [Desulfomicrobium norvegicum]
MIKNKQSLPGQYGMTLIEVLVAMAISSLVMGAIYSIFQSHQRIAAKQEQTSLMQQELLSAMSLISEELRMCGYSAQGTLGFGFLHRPEAGAPDHGRATNQTAVYCRRDWNNDGLINESGSGSLREHSGFRLNVANDGSAKAVADNVLRKYDTGAVRWQPISTNIGALRFTYFNAEGAVIPDPQANPGIIRGVKVEITAIPSPLRASLKIGNRTMSTMVWCRNLGTDKRNPLSTGSVDAAMAVVASSSAP